MVFQGGRALALPFQPWVYTFALGQSRQERPESRKASSNKLTIAWVSEAAGMEYGASVLSSYNFQSRNKQHLLLGGFRTLKNSKCF
eukprot:1148920-Pelagomonas_calceolata.AAC.8